MIVCYGFGIANAESIHVLEAGLPEWRLFGLSALGSSSAGSGLLGFPQEQVLHVVRFGALSGLDQLVELHVQRFQL